MKFSSPIREISVIRWPLLLILLGIALRISLLFKYPDLWFCSDEANLGLMAMDLIEDGKFRIFIAGESYGGFLSIAISSLFMLLTGSPFIGIKLTPLLFFVSFAIALYALSRQIFNEKAALIAVALVSLSPCFLTHMGIRERGPQPETLFLGTLLMWLTLRVNQNPRTWFLWGLLAGFSWYTHYLSAVYLVPCTIFLAVAQRRFRSLRLCGVTLTGFFSGSFLYWVYVIQNQALPPFTTSQTNFFNPLAGFKNFLIVGFPVLVGGRWSFHREDLLPVFSKLVVLFYAGALLVFFTHLVWKRVSLTDGRMLLALHLALYPFIFAFSSFAWFAEEPRYLIGLYSSLTPVAGWLTYNIWRHSKTLAISALAILIGVSTYSTMTMPPDVFNTIFAEPNKEVIRFLKENDLKHFYANYWIVYRLMFESERELIGANYFDLVHERYPEYKAIVDNDPNPAYVAWDTEAPPFEEKLRSANRTYTKHKIGRYVIFYSLHSRD